MKTFTFFRFLAVSIFLSYSLANTVLAQSNCGYTSPTMQPQTTLTLICPGETTPAPPLDDAGDPALPNLEYVIVNNTNRAGGFPRIIGISENGETTFDNLLNLATGDEVCFVPVRYNLNNLQSLVDAIFTGSLGTLTCCNLLNLLLDNACGAINELGIYGGSDVENLIDVMAVIEVLDGGSQSIPTWLSAINNVNGQGAILPAACGSSFLPICYALDTAQKVCYQYGLKVSFDTQQVSTITGSDGSTTASVTGIPDDNLSYVWSNGSISNTITGLTSGNYCVTVTDNTTLCMGVACVFVPHICSSFSPEYATQNVSCNGQSDGFYIVTLKGGTPPYTVQWNDGTSQIVTTSGSFASKFNLSPGIYSVTTSDANGCNATHITSITQPAPIVFDATLSVTVLSVGETLQATIANITGGNGSYFARWQFGDGAFVNNFTAIHIYNTPGLYTVTAIVEDLSACNKQTTFQVTVMPTTSSEEAEELLVPVSASVVSDILFIQAPQSINGKVKLILVNACGQVVWQDMLTLQNGFNSIDISRFAKGIYFFALEAETGIGTGKFMVN